jgi:hypothetical protein
VVVEASVAVVDLAVVECHLPLKSRSIVKTLLSVKDATHDVEKS